ncbi:MAG TPA: protein kinase [Ktedonobacteraceae bacterium]|nr:protein kinase [Ktedonobacteraceae bacterium]
MPSQPLIQRRTTPNDVGMTVRNLPRPPSAGGVPSFLQPAQPNTLTRLARQPSNARPLLPGVQLRGNRYRLQELLERQDWLSGVFEAIWIGKDSQRGGARVMISEVALPEMSSVMSQSILRTATMALANVGRHPRIPALWDAFGDQGRSFFVFEPIEGESLLQRLRYSGRPLPEQDVIECCLQITEVLDLLSQQSPQLVHGLIRPEHIIAGRGGPQYFLTNFSVVLAGGATQFVVGLERTRLSPYTPPEFVRGLVDVRTDMYSLIATAYHAVTGLVPSGINGSIPQAQRINHAISSEFDAILTKGLRAVANQRYQRPSELRQELLALRSVSGSLASSGNRNATSAAFPAGDYAPTLTTRSEQQVDSTQRKQADYMPPLPIRLNTDNLDNEQVLLLPKPEELPPLRQRDDRLHAALWLAAILISVIILVVLSRMYS